MNKESKGYSVILYLFWPLSALFIALKNFDSKFGRNLLIALYAFLGFTALKFGDLERYAEEFYLFKTASFSQIFDELTSLQNGKIYNSFVVFLTSLVFETHHFYFAILFTIYGYFYINTVNLIKDVYLKELDNFGKIFFYGVLLFLFISAIGNLAFYTGGVYMLYCSINYYKTKNKKHLFMMLFVPLFHIGLAIYLVIPLLLLLFRDKTWYYIAFVVVTFIVGQSSITGAIQSLAESNSGTIIESKYTSYASDQGLELIEDRYEERNANFNIKLQALNYLQSAIWYIFVPLGIILIYLRKKVLLNITSERLLHIALLFWGVANVMLNISQGSRFVVLFSFISIALFFIVYIDRRYAPNKTMFKKFIFIFAPALFLYGLMSAYASNGMISIQFFISNFFIEIYNDLF